MANEPLVIWRRDEAKVVLVENRTQPIVLQSQGNSSIVIRRSDIPGPKGEKGDKGDPGDIIVSGDLPPLLDGGFA